MGQYTFIWVFAILDFMGWYGCSHTPRKMIDDIGINIKYYPKGYIMPGRRFRTVFKLKKKEIPKWIYFELCFSIVYIISFVLFTLVFLLANAEGKYWAIEIFTYIWELLTGPNMIYVPICEYRYRKK